MRIVKVLSIYYGIDLYDHDQESLVLFYFKFANVSIKYLILPFCRRVLYFYALTIYFL